MRAYECIAHYWSHRPAAIVVDEPTVEHQFFEALRLYVGYQELRAHRELREAAERCYLDFQQPDLMEKAEFPAVGDLPAGEHYSTCITLSEWAKIRPLFELYVERENAMHLEASRMYGIDVYGRSVSEVQTDITAMEEDYSHRVFQHDMITV